MNPLTLVKRIQNINKKEATLGISEEASWHAKYKHSAYVYVGGIPFDLTEGDLLAVFAQYGEIVDVNLVRDKGTGKSKGFAFFAYEDQRSTNLAVDNLNGTQILGRIIRVDHVNRYTKLEEDDEETKQRKREERGICHAFQKGECTCGDSCKFFHDEQRADDTGWGAEDDRHSRWSWDNFGGSVTDRRAGRSYHTSGSAPRECQRSSDKDPYHFRAKVTEAGRGRPYERAESNTQDHKRRVNKKQLEQKHKDVHGSSTTVNMSRASYTEQNSTGECDWRNEKRSRKYESGSYQYGRERSSRSSGDRDASQHYRRRNEDE